MSMANDLQLVNDSQREIKTLTRAHDILYWDMQTYMPPDAIKSRGEQLSLLQKLTFERETASDYKNAISRLSRETLPPRDARMIEILHERLERQEKLSSEFVEKLSRATTVAHGMRMEAQKSNDYRIFSPALGEIIHLLREKAELIGEPGHVYNSMLIEYEKGMTVEKIDPIFSELKKKLVELLSKIEASSTYKNQTNTTIPVDTTKLTSLVKDVVHRMGLRENNSRLDLAEHPFTTKLGVNDVRITTSYQKTPLFGFSAAIHEAGHALYESNLPTEYAYSVLGEAPSYGIHESQSRFWECMIGQSAPFWSFYYPTFKEAFHISLSEKEWYAYINRVQPGMIRMISDEIHYGLHIILRYEMEKGIFEGKYEASELGDVWNQKTKEYFGSEPPHDGAGILQDGHWSGGAFGYFPTYTIGNMYAAQIRAKMKKDIPALDETIAKGDYSSIVNWLKTHVHQKGFTKDADEIIRDACGSGLDAKPYVDYLNEKYSQLYQL